MLAMPRDPGAEHDTPLVVSGLDLYPLCVPRSTVFAARDGAMCRGFDAFWRAPDLRRKGDACRTTSHTHWVRIGRGPREPCPEGFREQNGRLQGQFWGRSGDDVARDDDGRFASVDHYLAECADPFNTHDLSTYCRVWPRSAI